MLALRDLREFDPEKKIGVDGYLRAQKVVRHYRMCMKPLIDKKSAKENKSYLFGVQDMEEVKKMFKDPPKSGVSFAQYALMEKVRNVICAENQDTGLGFRLKCTDVTAANEKERDIQLLRNRSWIEPVQSGINQMMGLPPYSMGNDKGLFHGNVNDFDKMGLDPKSPEDIEYFLSLHYRLKHEIKGEEPINFCIKYNELDEMIPAWINDALAVKCCASRSYVDDMTGAITYKYLAPETLEGVLGIKPDCKDASALGYRTIMTISDLIALIGNEFDVDRDMPDLLQAISQNGAGNITGLLNGKNCIWGNQTGNTMQFNDFLISNVSVGYIEWKEFNASSHMYGVNKAGRLTMFPVNYYSVPKSTSMYQKDTRYYQTTYKAYYLAYNDYDCRLFKYGTLNYQVVEGAEDEYSGFSIQVAMEYGKSIVDIARPYIDIYEKTMKKMEFMIVRAKPPGRMWSFESLLTMAKSMFPKIPVSQAITSLMERFAGMPDEMYAIPTVNGNAVGGGGAMNFDLPHGLSQSIPQFKDLAMWFDSQIMDKIGISPLRAAYAPGEKDGLGLAEQSTAYSEKATAYLPRMIQKMTKNISIRTLSFVQDILQYKNSLAYKWLLTGLGDETMEALDELKKVSFHRYNIFVEGLYTMAEKREVQMLAQQALQKGDITYEQWLLIRDIDSPRKAVLTLAYEKKRNDRVKQSQQMQLIQGQQQLEQQKHQNKMEEINLEGRLGNDRENTRGFWYAEGQKISAKGAMDKQNAKIDADPELIKQKEDAKIAAQIADATKEQVQPMATSAAPSAG